MREPGFQVYGRDPEPRPVIRFNVELRKDGELLDTQELHTDFTDDGILAIVEVWSQKFSLNGTDVVRITKQIKEERNVRRPAPRML